ncbi:MAG: DciA family protein [Alkalimonas sp.]|nr:DciA family protein [Alkalimonas sp.]
MARYSQKPTQLTHLLTDLPLLQRQQSPDQLQRCNQLLTELLQHPDHGCQVGRIKHGRAVILCQSAAWATRVKMQRDAILDNFRQKILPDLAGLDIEITPNSRIRQPEPKKTTKQPTLSDDAAQRMEQLAASSSGPLRESLLKLAAKRRAKG